MLKKSGATVVRSGAGVVSEAPTAREALSANNEAMAELHRVIKERGIAAKDIQTTHVNVNPRYSQPQPQPATGGSERNG